MPDAPSPPQPSRVAFCANCHGVLTGPFCAQCGQDADTYRRRLSGLMQDFVADIASFDSRILRTVLTMVTQPGELAAAFREGRRQRYVPALRLYMFVSLIFFLALSYGNIAIAQFGVSAVPRGTVLTMHSRSQTPTPPPTHARDVVVGFRVVFLAPIGTVQGQMAPALLADLKAQLQSNLREVERKGGDWVDTAILSTLLKLTVDPAALNGALTEWMPRALFLLLPLFALVLTAFQWRRRDFYFVDHLVFSLNYHSFAFAAVLVAALFTRYRTDNLMFVAVLGILFAYLVLAMRRFYGQKWLPTCAKALGVGLVYTVFILLPVFGGVIAMGVLYG